MKSRIPTTLGIATAILCFLSAGMAFAGPEERRAMLKHAEMTVTEAMEAAVKEFPGEVVKVMMETEQGKPVYLVEVVGKGGETREFFFDAKSGKMVKQRVVLEAGKETPGGRESYGDEPALD